VRYEPGGQAGALGEVIVVDPGAVGLDIGARSSGGAAVELHPTVHALVTARQPSSTSLETTNGPPEGRTDLRTFIACVPLDFEGLARPLGELVRGLVNLRHWRRAGRSMLQTAPRISRFYLLPMGRQSSREDVSDCC
jgi:hypothetical protein